MDSRQKWLELVRKYRYDPDRPGSEDYWAPALETCSPDRLRDIQNEKLQAVTQYVYENSPFYRGRFDCARLKPPDIRTVDDLEKIPLTTKEDMARDAAANPPWGTYLCIDDATWRRRGWMMFTTGGTTAEPRAFRHTLHDRDQWAWNDARALWSMGIRQDSVMMIAFSYAPHVFLWGVHYACNLMGIPVIPASLDTRRRAYFLDRFRPTVLAATPSYLVYLGESMKQQGYDPAASSVCKLVAGGEPGACIPATKRRIEDLWGAELHEFIGCTEASPTAGGYTCVWENHQRGRPMNAHLMDDIQVWEVVDPETHHPVGEGQRGLAVVTNLFSEAAPLLRFLVGDYTTLCRERCGCGRTHTRAIGGFQGRADDMVIVRGMNLFPTAVEEVVRSLDGLGNEFQIVLSGTRGRDQVALEAEAAPAVGEGDYSVVAEKVADELAKRLELRFTVEVKAPGTLPRTEFKARRVTDRRTEA